MNKITPVLALETSDKICSVCLLMDNNEFFSVETNQLHSHSEKLFEQIEIIQQHSGTNLSQIKSIAVSIGPGSFTGLRIGLSAAKGLIEGLKIPLIPVPTFEALAYQISSFLPDGTNFCIANRANKDECYFAKFFVKGNSYIFDEELKLISQSELDGFKDSLIFGNLSNNTFRIASPSAEFVAKWANNFGIEKLVADLDFIEPNYIKDFIVKEAKK
jgi:tRNA threonylcarbamoyladenosine biosynthesis protein TsaB